MIDGPEAIRDLRNQLAALENDVAALRAAHESEVAQLKSRITDLERAGVEASKAGEMTAYRCDDLESAIEELQVAHKGR